MLVLTTVTVGKAIMSNVHKGYADTEGGQLHYAEAGEGEPLLLIAETPRTYRFFDRLLPLLSPHLRAIAVDLPGLGNSHPLPDPLSVPALASCLARFVAALGLERANVFGMHTGNKVASAVAADWPGVVDRLIIAGQTHSLILDPAERNAALAPSFERYHAQQDGRPGDPDRLLREWLGAKLTLDATWWPDRVVNGEAKETGPIELAEAQVIDYLLGWRSAVKIYTAVFDYDLAQAVSRIQAPTLVLEFTTDEERHYGPQAARLAALMPNATTSTLAVSYLAAMVDQSDDIAERILAFLDGPRPGGRDAA